MEECSLHGLADASNKAYSGVVYLVYRTQVGRYARMLTSKTRVAPLKELSIPRLELMTAFVLVKLMNSGEWKQFVKHRVNEILKPSHKGDWRYIRTVEVKRTLRTLGQEECLHPS